MIKHEMIYLLNLASASCKQALASSTHCIQVPLLLLSLFRW